MTSKKKNSSQKKFLFDVHNFDSPSNGKPHAPKEPPPEVPNNTLPPLPTLFTEDQMEKARGSAFEEGRKKGIEEEKKRHSETIAQTLENIAQSLPALEAQKQKSFAAIQKDVIRITSTIFESLYPDLRKKIASKSLEEFLTDTITKQDKANKILVNVHPKILADIEKHIDTLSKTLNGTEIALLPNDTIDAGGCSLEWEGGGARFMQDTVAEEIKSILKEHLEPLPANSHDDDEDVMEKPDE